MMCAHAASGASNARTALVARPLPHLSVARARRTVGLVVPKTSRSFLPEATVSGEVPAQFLRDLTSV